MSMEQIKELYAAIKRSDERFNAALEEYDQANKERNRLAKDLGDVLFVHGLTEVSTSDGKKIGLKTTYHGSAAQGRIPAIREFLQQEDNVGILKPKKLKINEGDIGRLPEDLQENVEYEINANTLKAFLAELGKKGKMNQEIMDLFAVYQENTVVIK